MGAVCTSIRGRLRITLLDAALRFARIVSASATSISSQKGSAWRAAWRPDSSVQWTTSPSLASSPRSATFSRSRTRTRSRFARIATPPRPSAHSTQRRRGPARPLERLAIPGIGKDLAAKIGELIETGVIAYHQELLQEFPATILDLLHLQGVGPKTVALLYQELEHPDSRRARARRSREGRLRAVKGMGAKKEAQILQGDRASAPRSPAGASCAEAYDTAAALVGCSAQSRARRRHQHRRKPATGVRDAAAISTSSRRARRRR